MNAMHAGRRAAQDTQPDRPPRKPRPVRGRDAQRARPGPTAMAERRRGSTPAAGGTSAERRKGTAPPAGRRRGGAPPAGPTPPAGPRTVTGPIAAPPGAPGLAAAPTAVPGPVTSPAATRSQGTGPAAAPSTGNRRRALGRYGEDLAARRLTEAGMRILDRNWRCRDGEIDIVAADGDALVVCEVKTRRAGWYEHPMAAVRPEKTARLRLLAERWLERHGGPPPGGVRIDVIGILLPARGAPVVQHARGVA